KGFLFMRRGDFSQAADIFRNTLNYAEELPSEEKKKYIPELKRSLAIVYRMQGEYNTALAWFSEAMAGFQTIQDELGIFKVLLGVARIHSLRGEWNKATNTYNQVIESYSYRKPDQWLLATYSELVDSLLAAGDYSKAKEMLDKVNDLLEEVDLVTEKDENIHLSFQIQFIRFYQNEKNFELALKEIQKVWDQFNALEEKEIDLELNILKTEIEILLDLDRCDDARKKLEALFPNLKSDWMKATYWQLMGILEQREMNLGSAKSALERAIVKSKEIGHYQLLVRSRILYATLLVDQAKLGSQSAFQKADDYLKEIETEMKDQQMTPRVLDCQILRATLASLQKDYDSAYQLLSDVGETAKENNLYQQQSRAQNQLDLLEQEQGQLKEATRKVDTLSVFRYLDDARRLVDEHGS
ncbi:MAG: tetratricopeptide repeat protein, partial [Candidatus Hodarchaeota archaeon]